MFFFNSAARLGRDDGKINYPNEERGTASFTIYDDASDVYDNTHVNGRSTSKKAERTISLSLAEITMLKISESKINKIVEKLDSKKEVIESALVNVEMEFSRINDEYLGLREKFFKSGELRRPNRLIKSFFTYLFLMLMLVVFEWYFNYDTLLQSMSGDIKYGSIYVGPALVSSGLSLALMIIAHFVGIKLRQWQKSWQWKTYLMAILGVASIGLMLYALTEVRHINNEEAKVSASYSFDMGSEEPDPASKEKAPDEDNKEIYFGMFSFMFIIAAITLSFFSHDPDPELERVYEQEIMLHKKILKLSNKRMELAKKYDKLFKIFKQKIERLQNKTLTMITEYRDYNCKYRKTAYPANSDISLNYFKQHDLGHELDITDPLMSSKMKKDLEDIPKAVSQSDDSNNIINA